jgi:hypothetical protein
MHRHGTEFSNLLELMLGTVRVMSRFMPDARHF